MRHGRTKYNGKTRPLRKGPECRIIFHAVRPDGRCVGGLSTCAGLRVLAHPRTAAFLFSMSNYITGFPAMQAQRRPPPLTFPPFNAIVPPEISVDGEETAMRRAERGPFGARAPRQAAAVPLPSRPGRPGRIPHVTADASGAPPRAQAGWNRGIRLRIPPLSTSGAGYFYPYPQIQGGSS